MELKVNNQVVHDMNGKILNYQFDHFPDINEEIEVEGIKYLVREITKGAGEPDMITVGEKQKVLSNLYVNYN